jgi:sialic acid synthase SpsE/sugar phosphate isomerase/epimerase
MSISIGRFEIGGPRVFVIAEIGNNHNGSLERAKHMVAMAVDAGADCVKFQMRHLDEIYRQQSLARLGEDLGTEYVLDLLAKFELTVDEHRKLNEYCRSLGVLYLCTPWDARSVEVLEEFGVPAFKVASADLTNMPLLDVLARTKKPLIISTGMSRESEIRFTVDFLDRRQAQYVLLHCNSTYPAPLQDINLRWMNHLKNMHDLVGYSGHERGVAVSLAAVALGACVIERHFTLDRMMEGPDHAASLEQVDFERLVKGVREIEQSLGDGLDRRMSQGEMINRENLGKSLVAARMLAKGRVIAPGDIKIRSPGQGLSPQKYDQLVGRALSRDMEEEDFFFGSDIGHAKTAARQYTFSRPYGVPVRYHDLMEYVERAPLDFVEFHFSYTDMELHIKNYVKESFGCGFVVHAPELFEGSHLMDLASPDEGYRSESLRQTQRIIDITRELKAYFPNTERPLIVANLGGFSMDRAIAVEERPAYYERLGKSLQRLDAIGVEIIPQTMAPFPWHFGGQRHQNLFVLPEEITMWCRQLNLRMCFDVSHSMLACNHFKRDFYSFAEEVAPYTVHLHIGDASGVNGEGLQIGEGGIDFGRLGRILKAGCPTASFIPEIWQGHKNGGEGFWIALERLEGLL